MTSRTVNVVQANGLTVFAGTLRVDCFAPPIKGKTDFLPTPILPVNANVQALHTFNNNLFAATFGDGIFRSINNGGAWTSAGGGLTNNYLTALASHGDRLFAAGDH